MVEESYKQKKYKQLEAKVNKLQKDLEYSRECLGTRDKYWSKIMVERNSYLLETEWLKRDIKELEAKVLDLEHELYYERRNKRISEMYSEKE